MSNEVTILISVYDSYGKQILRIAVKNSRSVLTDDVIKYYKEPENEELLTTMLPSHCRGIIVNVEEIFESVIINHNL